MSDNNNSNFSYSNNSMYVKHPYDNTENAPETTIQQQQQPDTFENQFWQERISEMHQGNFDFKLHQLPLARIKKVMKSDQDVKMISAEAPILFSKGCDIFITELTLRAWKHAVENKRRTLQRSDIAAAISKSDIFDFLIDIVPREEINTHVKTEKSTFPSQQQQYDGNQYGNYGYELPPQTQYMMNDPNVIQQQQQHQQLYMQQQLMNQQQMYNNRPDQPPNNNNNNNNNN